MSDTAPDTLAAALSRYEIELPDDQVAALDEYRRLLWDFNQRLNLTRHTDFTRFVTRDVVDSLQLAALLEPGEKVLDMGTGGGVPGVIVAILRDDVHVSLCESVGKRARAVEQIVRTMTWGRAGLPVTVHHARAEELLAEHRYDAVLARAVAPLAKMLKWLAPHWASAGRLLTIKGSRWPEERGEARHRGLLTNLDLRRVAVYKTPGTDAENVVLKVSPKSG